MYKKKKCCVIYLDNEAIAKLLIKNGANINAKDSEGQTPVQLSRYRGTSMIKILRNYENLLTGNIFLLLGHKNITELLIQNGAKT